MSDGEQFADQFGPIVYFAVHFPGGVVGAAGFAELLDLVDRHVLRVLDLEVLRKSADGTVALVEPHDLVTDGTLNLAVFDGARSGLLDEGDFASLADELATGDVAVVVIYEELAMLPVLQAWAASGGQLMGEGSIDLDELDAALDATA